VLAQAATGTGKTAAFALPLLHRLSPDAPARQRTAALILVPTRELAMQVAEAVHRYGKVMHVVALPIYGGASMETQIRSLKRGVDVVVATPGRALDHIRRGTLQLDSVRWSCSTRPTRCSTWASPRTSRRSSSDARGAPDGALLGDAPAAHRRDRRSKHLRDPVHDQDRS
jgi:hypothetical protein